MLDTATKRRIDTARDILVGKVPDPKSQVEQITIALIYKFMDDIDAASEELGGQRTFFAGDFARYGWPQLVRAGLGGHETLNLYAEAITRMPENPGIPPLFRDIFNNAYLPYRDPETLRAFLKVIDEFTYDHSERLGDAFEYLLSVLGSQGDAGQFRTPRHIIDFIVAVIDPKKDETILDPACGTAGFLISSYKHILKSNIDDEGNSTLTPDEKGTLAANIKGYDISPDMVRLSLVNLYLHGFVDPHISEYDTLTSEERWNEYADVILANPPFMSPKGGIRPHRRFSVQSKRSEVLFVDYMAEHLTPTGRAGIIVPEGIVFQSQNAYKQLRKMLVENYLVAVISLPAGVFQPYSGVKTSILLLDKALANKTDRIAFFKVENDGFGLGAQRREIAENDLPKVREELGEYLGRLRVGESVTSDGVAEPKVDYTATLGLIAEKEKIAASGEYNLSGERYRERGISTKTKWPMVELGEVAEYINGFAFKPEDWHGSGTPIIRIQNLTGSNSTINLTERCDIPDKYVVEQGDLLISWSATIGFYIWNSGRAYLNQHIFKVVPSQRIIKLYLYYLGRRIAEEIKKETHGNTMTHITKGRFNSIQIPLPPLEVQQEIVSEIEGYQRVIDGARAVIDNYRPQIVVDPEWLIKELSEVAVKITDGTHTTPNYTDSGIPFLRVTDITKSNTSKKFISEEEHMELIKRCHPQKGDVLYSKNGTIGIAKVVDWGEDFSIFVSLALIKPRRELVDSRYLECFLNSDTAYEQATSRSKSGTVTNLHLVDIKTIQIPLPSLTKQQEIVAEIEAEQSLVAANRELMERMEGKIRAAIGRVWGTSNIDKWDGA